MSVRDHELIADFADVVGPFRNLNGANLGPLAFHGSIDLSARHRELGFSHIRLHDAPYGFFNTLDISNIFPLFHADESNPVNYIFLPTDDYIQSILDCGSEIVYRLGQTIEHSKRRKYFIHPPADFDKWARICVNIVRHYNDGWAGGHHHGIRYWEIWGEPDVERLWSGTPEQYYRLYEVTARALKAHDPSLRVGGPSLGCDARFAKGFLAHCHERKVPLDFYSWHNYNSLAEVSQRAVEYRQTLNAMGMQHVESHLNEWNCSFDGFLFTLDIPRLGAKEFAKVAGPEGAAYAAAMLCLLQDLPIDVANYYWTQPGYYGMFDQYGAPNKTFFAFKAFRLLRDLAPNRVGVTGNDPATGVAMLAGLSADKQFAGVLVANANGPRIAWDYEGIGKLRVAMSGLPWPAEARVYVIDGSRSLSPRETIRVGGGSFDLDLPAPGVALLELRPAG